MSTSVNPPVTVCPAGVWPEATVIAEHVSGVKQGPCWFWLHAGAADLRDFNQYSHTNKAGVASNAEARASWLRVRNKVMGHPELSRTIRSGPRAPYSMPFC
eukprot:1159015-Pelagomonas_calceolata.AAC.3